MLIVCTLFLSTNTRFYFYLQTLSTNIIYKHSGAIYKIYLQTLSTKITYKNVKFYLQKLSTKTPALSTKIIYKRESLSTNRVKSKKMAAGPEEWLTPPNRPYVFLCPSIFPRSGFQSRVIVFMEGCFPPFLTTG